MVKDAADIKHNIDAKVKKSLGLRPNPKNFLQQAGKPDVQILKRLSHSSILSAEQFTADLIIEVYKLAALLQQKWVPTKDTLHDKILATAFFEPSTRTRLSFESAMLFLGGKTLSVAEAASTGIAKGESMTDIGQMFNSYANAVVVRHTEQKALDELSRYLRIPLINGGNGSDEHPTQALADWYALAKWNPDLILQKKTEEKFHLGIVGTPANMRTVKSFLLLSLLFEKKIEKITIISEMANPLGSKIPEYCEKSNIDFAITDNLHDTLPDLDVVYMNSIAFLGDGYRMLGTQFKLSAKSSLKKGAVILHPLARKEELDVDLDDTEHNLYFNQADGAVFIRQALLLCIFDRLESIEKVNI
ncbi:MAG: aspartate carbamoyltransferase [Spirochaetota bacterium]